MNNKMITEILDERVFSDGNTVPKWKKYNEGIMKAVQVIKQYQANEVSTSAEALPIAGVVGQSEQLIKECWMCEKTTEHRVIHACNECEQVL